MSTKGPRWATYVCPRCGFSAKQLAANTYVGHPCPKAPRRRDKSNYVEMIQQEEPS